METITIILGIVMLVFGILQIILFFKVWGMTNNVKRISNQLFKSNDILKEIHKNNPNIGNILFDAVYADFHEVYMKDWGDHGYKSVKEKYKPLYQKVSIEFPKVFENINNDKDMTDTFKF